MFFLLGSTRPAVAAAGAYGRARGASWCGGSCAIRRPSSTCGCSPATAPWSSPTCGTGWPICHLLRALRLRQWLEEAHGFSSFHAGLVMLPMSGAAAFCSMLGARTKGIRAPLTVAAACLAVGSAVFLLLQGTSPLVALLCAGALFGIPAGPGGHRQSGRRLRPGPGRRGGLGRRAPAHRPVPRRHHRVGPHRAAVRGARLGLRTACDRPDRRRTRPAAARPDPRRPQPAGRRRPGPGPGPATETGHVPSGPHRSQRPHPPHRKKTATPRPRPRPAPLHLASPHLTRSTSCPPPPSTPRPPWC